MVFSLNNYYRKLSHLIRLLIRISELVVFRCIKRSLGREGYKCVYKDVCEWYQTVSVHRGLKKR